MRRPVAGVGIGAMSLAGRAQAQTAPTDFDVLNFALNLEYLEAQFYNVAVFGTGLAANMQTGTGTQGAVVGGRKVTFTDPDRRRLCQGNRAGRSDARHVPAHGARDRVRPHSRRSISTAARPVRFTALGRAAGIATNGAGAIDNVNGTFDPYASDNNFLLGAFVFEDVGVTAYKGASPLITNKTYLEAAAGILAVEAYHAGLVRTVLYAKGVATPSLRTSADAISNARDSVDGTSDDDQGISPTTINGALASNIVPLDSNGLAYSRTTGQVLNVVYLNNRSGFDGRVLPGRHQPARQHQPSDQRGELSRLPPLREISIMTDQSVLAQVSRSRRSPPRRAPPFHAHRRQCHRSRPVGCRCSPHAVATTRPRPRLRPRHRLLRRRHLPAHSKISTCSTSR